MDEVIVFVPATSANLGPGFDCLGLALDLWNTTAFRLGGEGIRVSVKGEGSDILPSTPDNLVVRAFSEVYRRMEATQPGDIRLECENLIPLGSGMGSSAAAVLTGLLAANCFLGEPLSRLEILRIANEIEGHPDNAAAALFGGLVTVLPDLDPPLVHTTQVKPLDVILVLPDISLSTKAARDVLPAQVGLKDAVHNLGRTALVVKALHEGDLTLLAKVMDDRLHQPYRLGLIPGAEQAIRAAQRAGAAAALSGAGPGVIAFVSDETLKVEDEMRQAFLDAKVESRVFRLRVSTNAARWYA